MTKEIKLLTDFSAGSLFVCVVLLEGILNKFIVHGNLLLVTNGYFEVYLLKSLALTVVIEAWERKKKGFHSICLKKMNCFLAAFSYKEDGYQTWFETE